MNALDLDALQALDTAASAGPWRVMFTDNDMRMSATLVIRNPDAGRIVFARDATWEPDDVVAAYVLQSPKVATSSDGGSDGNARLIAAMRNAIPELLRLARLGRYAEGTRDIDSPTAEHADHHV